MSSIWTKFDDIKQINMVNVPGGLTAKQVKAKYPDAGIISTMTLFVLANSINFVRFEDENKSDGYLGGEGIGIQNEKDLVWCIHKEAYDSDLIRDFCAGFPPLVKDGKLFTDKEGNFYWGPKYSAYVDGDHKRLVVGFNKNMIIILASDNPMTLKEAGMQMIYWGCTHAINCDGGPWSPHLQKHNTIYRQGYRKNPTWLLIYLDKRKAFVELAKDKLGRGYAYGTQGETLTPSLIKYLVKTFGKDRYYFPDYSVEKWLGMKVDDCSGVFVDILRELGSISNTADYNAKMIYSQLCYPINDLENGDLVFYSSLGHVGMYLNGKVLEARGTKYGVVLSDRLSAFSKYARLKYL